MTARASPATFCPAVPAVCPAGAEGLGRAGTWALPGREIVTAHGGTIEAASSLGEGTVIVVRLPLGKRSARVDPLPAAEDRA